MKGKRITAIVLSLLMVLALTPVASAFGDIKGLKGEKHITHLKERGVIKGDSKGKGKGSYHPQAKLSYAQAVVMLDEAFELDLSHIKFVKEPKVSDIYKKVKDGKWYSEAFLHGFYNGIELDKNVNPNASITREEFAALLINQVDRKGDYALIMMHIDYKDIDKAKDEYKDEIQKLLLLKFAELSKNGNFNPTKPITREEAAIWLDKALTFVDETFGNKDEENKPSALTDVTFKTEKVTDQVNKVTVSATVPHPGYGIAITEITFDQDTAYVKIKQVDPDPNKMYPQVISTAIAETYVASQYKVKLITP